MTAASPTTLRVLIADDHRLMLAAVRRALSRAESIEIVGEIDEATKIAPAVGRLLPDVVLLDIRMPQLDGLTCLERLHRLHPDVAVVILSTFAGDDHVEAARERGASGYIVKTVDPLRLAEMVHTAVSSPEFVVFRPEVADSAPPVGEEHGLSERELSIVRALAQGLTNKQIGTELCVSEQTVKFHLRNVYRKLSIGSRVGSRAVGDRERARAQVRDLVAGMSAARMRAGSAPLAAPPIAAGPRRGPAPRLAAARRRRGRGHLAEHADALAAGGSDEATAAADADPLTRAYAGETARMPAAAGRLGSPARKGVGEKLAAAERRLRRISLDLHDGPAQDVAALASDAALLEANLADPERLDATRALAAGIRDGLAALGRDIRDLAEVLEPRSILRAPIREVLEREAAAFARRAGFTPTLAVDEDLGVMTASQHIALARVAREALTNVRDHAEASAVRLTVTAMSEGVSLVVTDDGKGFDVTQGGERLGLAGMHERVRLLGGRLVVESRPGGPTRVSATIPRWRPSS